MMSLPDQSRRLHAGFTLIEMSIVLAVMSLLGAGILAVATQNIRRSKTAELQKKMDAIEMAMLDFSRMNNRLPCPADGTVPVTNPGTSVSTQNFGVEGTATGDCTDGSTYSSGSDLTGDGGTAVAPDANFYDGSNTVGGIVPVRTLGLPDDYAFDPWGGRLSYFVDKRLTAASAFTTYKATNTSIGSITVYDGSAYPATGGNARTTTAIAVVMSHGGDGHGAFQLSGVRKSSGATNVDELQNCHCTGASPPAATTFDYKIVQHPATASSSDPLNVFDDIVRFYTRGSFLSSTDVAVR
jgi:prepilin-type N-terminal cleavage/methylation domain-containing protein